MRERHEHDRAVNRFRRSRRPAKVGDCRTFPCGGGVVAAPLSGRSL
ncbi:MAG: hypothetical protein QM699_11845 [Amaricoccus sp.]